MAISEPDDLVAMQESGKWEWHFSGHTVQRPMGSITAIRFARSAILELGLDGFS